MVSFPAPPPNDEPPPDPPRPEGFPAPGPEFSPEQVVQFQLYALQHNEQPEHNSGIAAAFDFASPENRERTGPLSNFIAMIHNESYGPMLNFVTAEFGPCVVSGDTAHQPVFITGRDGRRYAYVWVLSRQPDGPLKDCWLTDAVIVP
jgi:hypothetical protein